MLIRCFIIYYIYLLSFWGQAYSCAKTNNFSIDRELLTFLENRKVLNKLSCLNKIEKAITQISFYDNYKHYNASKISLEIQDLLKKKSLKIYHSDDLGDFSGRVDDLSTNEIKVNCNLSLSSLTKIILHEYIHIKINKQIAKDNTSPRLLDLIFYGHELLADYSENPYQFIKNISEGKLNIMIMTIYEGLYQEISAYNVQYYMSSDKDYMENKRILKELNESYFIPKYKFAMSLETYEFIKEEIDKSVNEEVPIISFINSMMEKHRENLKQALMYYANKKRS